MSDRICMVCGELVAVDTQSLELRDDKEKVLIEGHINCTNEVYDQIKSLNGLHKMTNKQVLKEINLKLG